MLLAFVVGSMYAVNSCFEMSIRVTIEIKDFTLKGSSYSIVLTSKSLKSRLGLVTHFLDSPLCHLLSSYWYPIVKFTQLCSKCLPTAHLNFACDRLAFNRDISLGRLTSPNVCGYIPIES